MFSDNGDTDLLGIALINSVPKYPIDMRALSEVPPEQGTVDNLALLEDGPMPELLNGESALKNACERHTKTITDAPFTDEEMLQLLAMSEKQQMENCPTTPSAHYIGNIVTTLPTGTRDRLLNKRSTNILAGQSVVLRLKSDTMSVQILNLSPPDNAYTCYVPVQVSSNRVVSVDPNHLWTFIKVE